MDLSNSIVRIVRKNGSTAGTGFLASDRLVLTCAHVIEADNEGTPPERVAVEFQSEGSALRAEARLRRDCFRDVEEGDVACFEVVDAPPWAEPCLLAKSRHSQDHRFETFGFPDANPRHGLRGDGKIRGVIWDEFGQRQLQLSDTSELTQGFSGAPVWDVSSQRVVGMVTAITREDQHGRLNRTALAVPSETLLEICPELVPSEECPYRGLEAFSHGDRDVFFGRERLIDRLIDQLDGYPRFLALLGPSGSGKSSAIQAGLIPRLRDGALPRSDRWNVLITRPTTYAFGPLATKGSPPAAADLTARACAIYREGSRERLLIYIDQCEELFTSCNSKTQRAFLGHLAELWSSDLDLCLVISMRDEFYVHLARMASSLGSPGDAEQVLAWINKGIVNMPLLVTRSELQAMIEKPAKAAGASFGVGLVDRLIDDALADAVEEGGRSALATILPLLEFALTELWGRREDGMLTLDGYTRIAGLTGALTSWADQAYLSFKGADRDLVRRLITDLVAPGDEVQAIPDARRRRFMSQMGRTADDRQKVEAILHELADRPLLVTRYDPGARETAVELIHDALVRRWGRLKDWLVEDRDFLTWRTRLEPRVSGWSREEGSLLHGPELRLALDWKAKRGDDLTPDERTFLDESERQEREAKERLECLHEDAARQRMKALAAAAGLEFDRGAVTRSLLLGLEALSGSCADAEAHARAEAALLMAILNHREMRILQCDNHINQALFSPDGLLVLGACRDGTARLWEARNGDLIRTYGGHGGQVFDAGFAPDGERFVTASADGTARVFGLRTSEPLEVLSGHTGAIYRAIFSPDSAMLLTASADKTAAVWSATTGARLHVLEGHTDEVVSSDFSPDSTQALTGSRDATARLWDVASGACVAVFDRHSAALSAVCFGPDGDLIATASKDGTGKLWRRGNRVLPVTLDGHGAAISAIDFQSSGPLVATAGADGALRLFDRTSGAERGLAMQHQEKVFDVRFAPAGDLIASTSADGTVMLRDMKSDDGATTLRGHAGKVWHCAFAPGGAALLSSGEDGSARIWDVTRGRPAALLAGPAGEVHQAVFCATGARIVTAHEDGAARIWDTTTASVQAVLAGHRGPVWDVAWSPDGQRVASASRDGTARIWDATSGTCTAWLEAHRGPVGHVTFAPDGRNLATASCDGTAILWDGTGGCKFVLEGHAAPVWQVMFLGRGERLASVSLDKTARIWDAATGGEVAQLANHQAEVVALTASADGSIIATGSYDNSLAIFDGTTGRLRAVLEGHKDRVEHVGISPDGARLVSASCDNTARLWDVASGTLLGVLEGHRGEVVQAHFGPRGRLVVTASQDGTVRLWHARACQCVMILHCSGESVSRACFSSDGRRVLAASAAGNVRLFDLAAGPADDWKEIARSIAPRELSDDERRRYG